MIFEGSADTIFVCAHGAGGHMDDAALRKVSETLVSRGLGVVRFNFPYREKGSGPPDPMPRLMESFVAAVSRARQELKPSRVIIGGRSMGGRAASMLAAEGFDCDGLLLLAYPLHPAGKPERLRAAHLASLRAPVLCFNGTRDALCRKDLMESALASVKTRWEMRWLEGADHSFHVLKSSGRTDAQVLQEVGETSRTWLASLLNDRCAAGEAHRFRPARGDRAPRE